MKMTRKTGNTSARRLAMVALASLPALYVSGAVQAQPNLSNASFSGTYSRFGTDGAIGAGLGTCVADPGDTTTPPDPAVEDPSTAGSYVCENFVLSNAGMDEIIPATLTATFTVNADGSGSFTETIQGPDGTIIGEAVSDFVITKLIPGTGIAQEIYAVQRQDGPSGGLVTSTFKRLSD